MQQENNKNNRKSRGMRPLAYALNPITKKVFGKKSNAFGQLVMDWQTIMQGLDCNNVSPCKLSFPRGKNRGATLTLNASSSQAFTLQHMTPQILQRINQFFGYNAVDKINFIHQKTDTAMLKKNVIFKKLSPEKINQLEEKLNFVENDDMKKALVALGKSVIHKDQSDSVLNEKDV